MGFPHKDFTVQYLPMLSKVVMFCTRRHIATVSQFTQLIKCSGDKKNEQKTANKLLIRCQTHSKLNKQEGKKDGVCKKDGTAGCRRHPGCSAEIALIPLKLRQYLYNLNFTLDFVH